MPLAQPLKPGDAGELTESEQVALAAFAEHRRWGTGLLEAAIDPPADARLFARRLARGTVRVDHGEVLGLDRLRRASGKRAHSRRAARQRDAVLAARGTGASSARLYWESFRDRDFPAIGVPTGCSIFPKEIIRIPRSWAERRFTDLRRWQELDRGGHFAGARTTSGRSSRSCGPSSATSADTRDVIAALGP